MQHFSKCSFNFLNLCLDKSIEQKPTDPSIDKVRREIILLKYNVPEISEKIIEKIIQINLQKNFR